MFTWKYRIHAICILSVLAIIIIPQITNRPDANKKQATTIAAQEFLQMVDAEKYADSWLIADTYLKKTITQQAWDDKLTKIQQAIGPVTQRSLESVSFTAPAEELPDSEFILLEYSSQFKLKEVGEVVTVVLGEDNRWRVVGYFLQ